MSDQVAVIGMGLMGSALAKQLIQRGHEVVVWNRTPARCEPLKELGATMATTAEEAVARAGLVITITASCADLTQVLPLTPGDLEGKDVINLVTGSPSQIRDLEAAVAAAGGRFLSGAIQCYPSNIGQAEAVIVFAGNPDLWAQRRELLLQLAGASPYAGPDAALPNVVDASVTGCFLFSALAAGLEASSYAVKDGVDLQQLKPFLTMALKALPHQLDLLLDAVSRQDFQSSDATIEIYARSLEPFQSAFADAGASDLILKANAERMRRAIAAGDGGLGYAALSRH